MDIDVEVVEEDGGNDTELQLIVQAELNDAVSYIDSDLSPGRAQASAYYRGDLFGNEEDGNSKVVATEVRDTVRAMLPSLMRTVFSTERMVEFIPRNEEDVPFAEQATDYVNYILSNDNDGFGVMYSTFKDSLVRKCGIVKTAWEETEEVHNEELTGLDEETMSLIEMSDEFEVVAVEEYEDPHGEPIIVLGEDGEPVSVYPKLFDVEIKRVVKEGRVVVDAVPPEEFVIDRNARSLETAAIVGHRKMATVAELISIGYSEDEINDYISSSDELEGNDEKITRHAVTSTIGMSDDSMNPAMREVLYCELYLRYDYDGDGIPELRKICTMGNGYTVVNNDPADFVPFADFPYDPEPHTSPVEALSVYDYTKDLQEINSDVIRNTLDSLAQSIHPRTGVVEGQANMDDVLNNETGGVIRMRAPGMVQPFTTPFVGQQALPVLDLTNQMKENRTGMSKAAMGLDADAMQSTTKDAVSATISASQGQIELTARIMANGMKKLFKNILRIVVTHQDKARMIRLRNEWVTMDPRHWNSGMDVNINVMLGTGNTEQKMQMLNLISQKQEQILQTLGPQNPLVTFGQYSETLHKMTEMAGFQNSSAFFNRVPADWMPPPQQPQPTPEMILAEVQAQSIQADIQKKAAELELEHEEMIRKDDRERDQMEIDMHLKAAEIRAKHGAQIDMANIKAMVERDREAIKQQAQQVQQPQPYTGVN